MDYPIFSYSTQSTLKHLSFSTTLNSFDLCLIIIADHGNSDVMINEDGSPNTAHTTNPVPIIVVDKDIQSVADGILANIAPTVLKLIGIEKPAIMNEDSLI